MKRALLVGVCCGLSTACSDHVTQIGENTGATAGVGSGTSSGGNAGNGGGAGTAAGSGGAGGSAAAGGDLSGFWRLNGSVQPDGRALTGSLEVGAGLFFLAIGQAVAWFVEDAAGPSLSWENAARNQLARYITVNHDTAPLDLGVIPLPLGGTWIFQSPLDGALCSGSLSNTLLNGGCANVTGEPSGVPDMNANITAQRSVAGGSVFGELGGSWTLLSNGGQNGGCTATFAGSELIVACTGTNTKLDGTLTFTLGDGIASGSSSEGLEFSAIRE